MTADRNNKLFQFFQKIFIGEMLKPMVKRTPKSRTPPGSELVFHSGPNVE
jgi:hypothetical protein